MTAAICPGNEPNSSSTSSEIVEGAGQRVARGRRGDPGRIGETEGGDAASRLDEKGVGVTVITAGELDDLVPAGERPGEPDGAHGRLGAAVHQPQQLDGGHEVDDELGKFHLERGGRSVTRAPPHRLLQRLDHPRVGVAQDQRAPGEDVVQIAVAVDVVEIGALSPLDEARRSAHGAVGTHRTVDATRHQPLRLRPESFRFRGVHCALLCRLFSRSTTWMAVIWPWCTQSGRPTPRYGLPVTQMTRRQRLLDGLHPSSGARRHTAGSPSPSGRCDGTGAPW